MRLLIVKLSDAAHLGVSLSLVSEADVAELVESVDDAVALIKMRPFELVLLMVGTNIQAANGALIRLREVSPDISVVLLSNSAAQRPRSAVRHDPMRHANIALDMLHSTLSIDGQPIALSQAEFRIFAELWTKRGQTVSAEQLMDAIYPGGHRPESRVLPVFLFKLRRKLARAGMDDVIQTAVGRGFTIAASDPPPAPQRRQDEPMRVPVLVDAGRHRL